MGKWRAPTRADHLRFCEVEGWTLVRDARGRSAGHHITYELMLPTGTRARTRISRPPDRTDYGPGIWAFILAEQLQVDEETFWRCVRDGVAPSRGQPPPDAEAIPLDVVGVLVRRVGLSEESVASMTRAEAIERVQAYWSGAT